MRGELLERILAWTETPMIVLSFAWLVLVILDFTTGLSPMLQTIVNLIWGIFLIDFGLKLLVAPNKGVFLRHNWLTGVSLLLPALRILRIAAFVRLARVARAARTMNLVRLLTSLNRGMGAIGTALGRGGVGYVIALTILVTLLGAAGMAQFERPAALVANPSGGAASADGLSSYGEALWWTAMIMTTLGSDYWPRTVEGRLLGWLLALYALSVFGYITATIASFLIGQARHDPPVTEGVDGLAADLVSLRAEIAALRAQLTAQSRPPETTPPAGAEQPGDRQVDSG